MSGGPAVSSYTVRTRGIPSGATITLPGGGYGATSGRVFVRFGGLRMEPPQASEFIPGECAEHRSRIEVSRLLASDHHCQRSFACLAVGIDIPDVVRLEDR